METIQNLHVIKVIFLGPTNYEDSRVKIISERFRQSVTIGYDHYFNSTCDIAQNWLIKHGYQLIGKAEGKDCDYIISTTFSPLKPVK